MENFSTIDYFVIPLIKVLIVFLCMVISVPLMVLIERKVIGRIQERPGPNRVGVIEALDFLDHLVGGRLKKLTPNWLYNFGKKHLRNGELQPIVDGIKLLMKEDFIPPTSQRHLFAIAPFLVLVPAFLTFTIVPFGPEFTIGDHTIWLGLTDFPGPDGSVISLPIGILFYFAVTSLGVYGIVIAGWSSNNKYSLLGGIRSTAQLVSYELSLGLSLVGVLLIVGSFNLRDMIGEQQGGIWNWLVWRQPLGFLMFLVAGFGETNRLPFDLPEGESELGAGFHTEYSSMKFAIFMMAEYLNILTFAAIITTLFLGGYQSPIPVNLPAHLDWLAALGGVFWFLLKVFLIFFFFVLVRGTLPRLRYDQLMNLGWKAMFPLGVANVMLTAGILALGLPLTGLWLFVAGTTLLILVDRLSTAMKRKVLGHAA